MFQTSNEKIKIHSQITILNSFAYTEYPNKSPNASQCH